MELAWEVRVCLRLVELPTDLSFDGAGEVDLGCDLARSEGVRRVCGVSFRACAEREQCGRLDHEHY